MSGINHLPLAGDEWGFPFHIEGRPPEPPGKELVATYRAFFPATFRPCASPSCEAVTSPMPTIYASPGVVVINDYFARRYWPGEDAIGKRITFDDPAKNPSWLTVVGVAKNTARSNWVSPPEEEVFLPYLQNRAYLDTPSPPFAYLTLVVRTTLIPPRWRRTSAERFTRSTRTFHSLRSRPWIRWSLKLMVSRAFTWFCWARLPW